jgi:hypothetical protein
MCQCTSVMVRTLEVCFQSNLCFLYLVGFLATLLLLEIQSCQSFPYDNMFVRGINFLSGYYFVAHRSTAKFCLQPLGKDVAASVR